MDSTFRYSLLFALLGALFFIPFLGGVHLFDWDEINFAEISREMIITKDYFRVYVNFLPFWEKPPFFFWLQSAAMGLFRVNEFSARLPNALCGILTLVLLFRIGQRLYSTRFGILWAGAYFGSVLPFLYFKSGIIDPWFNLFMFLGLYYFIKFYWKKENYDIRLFRNKWFYLFLGGLILGFGVITKGPVAYLIVVLTLGVYWLFQRFRFYINPLHFIVFTVATFLVTFAWYGLEYILHGPWFIREFNKYQYRLFSTPDAGHAGFPGYHFVVLLFGVFPASVFAVRSFFRMPKEERRYQRDFGLWMRILFWVVLILFTIVKSKIVHYSSMCYFPMTFLAALTIDKIISKKIRFSKEMKAGLWIIGGIYILACLSLPVIGKNIESLKTLFQKDKFALANLQANVSWTWGHLVPGLFLLLVLVYGMNQFRKQKWQVGFVSLFGGTALFIMLAIIFFINNIESYSQRAAIEFAEARIGEDCYVVTEGYKSYVQLFYTRKQPPANPKSYDKEWLYTGAIDKPVYVITKVTKLDQLAPYPEFKKIGEKNGFVFFKREPEKPAAVP
ncbi:MAG: glycosyltransferase family 39 protein [Flavisolibacter sp.]|nr:glycosyltransferase family 39 protein [Flavisolibacter sp.]